MGLRRKIRRLFQKSKSPAPEPPGSIPNANELRRLGYKFPDFFIAGAARCGTTSLWEYLRQHPKIFMPPTFEFKEPSFFCELYGMKNWREYLGLFAQAGDRERIGEASHAYLTSPESAGRLRAVLPEARFIISLRNPAERAFSLYKWMHSNGYEPLPTFQAALQAEETERYKNPEFIRSNGQYYYNFLYYRSGVYSEQVRRFVDVFGGERVHVIIFEEFVQSPAAHLKAIFEFLGVDSAFVPRLEVHNPSKASYGAFESKTRSELLRRYEPSIRELESMLNRDLHVLWS